MTDKLVAITGSSGFLGSALCAHLLSESISVRPIVRQKTEVFSSEYAVGSIDSTTDWSGALSGVGCVIHCAARAHKLNDSSSDPLTEYRKTNYFGTLRLLEQCIEAGVKRFILISSAKVNGETTNHQDAFSSEDEAAPKDYYAISKHEAECAALEIGRSSGIEIVIIRPPLIYGPNVKANFYNLIRLINTSLPLPLGNAFNKRSLISINNLVDVVSKCIDGAAAIGQTFMVSDGRDLSVAELTRLISDAMGIRLCLIPIPIALLRGIGLILGKRQIVERLTSSMVLNIDRTKEQLNWHPPCSVEDGIKETVEAYLKNSQAKR